MALVQELALRIALCGRFVFEASERTTKALSLAAMIGKDMAHALLHLKALPEVPLRESCVFSEKCQWKTALAKMKPRRKEQLRHQLHFLPKW